MARGSKRERSPGHWELRVYVGDDPETGKPVQRTRTFHGGTRAADKALAQMVTEAGAGRFNRSSATVGQMLDKWLEVIEDRQGPRTVYEVRRKVDKRIKPKLGVMRLDRLEPDVLDKAYREWLAEGLSPTTVHTYHAHLSAVSSAGGQVGMANSAPTDRATPPQPAKKAMVVPTPERLSAILAAAEAEDPVLSTAIALAALTGRRRGELVALRWSDVNLSAQVVTIARSLTVAGGKQHVGDTKAHRTNVLALDPVALEVLRRRWAYMEDLSERADSPLIADPYVLSYNAYGARPVGPDTLTHRFTAVCRALELPALKALRKAHPRAVRDDLAPADRWPYRFHDLRHFNITTQIAAGVDPRTVAERAGHANPTMTLNVYAHALPER